MAGQTPIYGLPYQTLTDPPNGPDLGRYLAEGVEAELQRIDADLDAIPGLLGGTKWTGGGNLVTGLTTTELAIMTAVSVTIPPLTTVEISAGVRLLSSVASDTYLFRIRETNAAGAMRGEYTWTAPNNVNGYNQFFKAYFDNTTTNPLTVAYCVTAVRVGGTGSLTMIAGGAQHNTHILTSRVGRTGVITNSATP